MLPAHAVTLLQVWPSAQSLAQVSAWQRETPLQVTDVEPTGHGGSGNGSAHASCVKAQIPARITRRPVARIVILRRASLPRVTGCWCRCPNDRTEITATLRQGPR